MPFVKICVTKENDERTKEQKELLINGVTNLINEVLGKNKSSTVVIIEEIDTDNYGLVGKSMTNLRKKWVNEMFKLQML